MTTRGRASNAETLRGTIARTVDGLERIADAFEGRGKGDAQRGAFRSARFDALTLARTLRNLSHWLERTR